MQHHIHMYFNIVSCSHVKNTSDLESFCIIKLNRIGTSNNRIVCVTGDQAKQVLLLSQLRNLSRGCGVCLFQFCWNQYACNKQ